jgi:hypothetical protein
MKSAAFFHGLESPPRSEKNDALESVYDEVYAPAMDYSDPRLFDQVLAEIKKRKPDVLMGSSMGGWFAYCLSTLTGIPTLLFNPAVHSRSAEPRVRIGNQKAPHTLILGESDDVVNSEKTVQWFSERGIPTRIERVPMGHRVQLDIFSKWIKSQFLTKRISESKVSAMRLPTYEGFLLLEKNKTVEFFRQNPELLSNFSSGIDPHSKEEWDPQPEKDRNLERRRMSAAVKVAHQKLNKLSGADSPYNTKENSKNSWKIFEVISGETEGDRGSSWWEWGDFAKTITSSRDYKDFLQKNRDRRWKLPDEYGKRPPIDEEYPEFAKFLEDNFREVQRVIGVLEDAKEGIEGSALKGVQNRFMKMGLSVRDVEVAMTHVQNWTSMSRKKLPPEVWPLLQKISVDSSMLPTTIYRGIFIDGSKIKDEAKFLKQWYPGSKPGKSQGKATSWSVDRGTAADFMTVQDFIKNEEKGYYVLLKWTVDPKYVIADLRNLPVDHTFWNQQEIIVDPAATDYEVDTIIPGSAGSNSHREFTDTIKSGQGSYGITKANFALNFLNTPYETLSPHERMHFKRAAKMTVKEFMQEYPRASIVGWSSGPSIEGLAMPIYNYLAKHVTDNLVIEKVERNRAEFSIVIYIGDLQLYGAAAKASYEKIKGQEDFNQFAGNSAIVSSTGTISLLDDDYYDMDLEVVWPSEFRIVKDYKGSSVGTYDKAADAALQKIYDELGGSYFAEASKKKQSERVIPRNINIKMK